MPALIIIDLIEYVSHIDWEIGMICPALRQICAKSCIIHMRDVRCHCIVTYMELFCKCLKTESRIYLILRGYINLITVINKITLEYSVTTILFKRGFSAPTKTMKLISPKLPVYWNIGLQALTDELAVFKVYVYAPLCLCYNLHVFKPASYAESWATRPPPVQHHCHHFPSSTSHQS